MKNRLLRLTALAGEYCSALEQAREMEKDDFVARMLDLLPRIYWEFSDIQEERDPEEEEEEAYGEDEDLYATYLDEEYYESVRRRVETLLGADDSYLETFEEDMKYSDTPIGASVSEGLADIFQDLFNFVERVRESEGDDLEQAFRICKANFVSIWSQTLCNVMRPLNNIRYNKDR